MELFLKGGGFLVSQTDCTKIFTLEDFDENSKMMLEATREFVNKEIIPNIFEFENKNYALTEEIMKKAGQLGILGINIPEEYGGLGMDLNTSMLICGEISSYSGSVATAYGAHTGIGTYPILLYGSEEIKKKYLPKISSGEWMSCYNLTEPNAGSDANSGKTTAELSEDKSKYEITGQKIWISNAGFADVFIVFGKIEDDKYITGFVFEKSKVNGLSFGDEEKKLGLNASSTRQVFYDKVEVPSEQMLGKRGEGFKIAMNGLNFGRIKLCAATVAAAIKVLNESIKYSKQRTQFKTHICEFGAIQEKFANMATVIFASNAGLYRAGYNIDSNTKRILSKGETLAKAKVDGISEYSIECAITKAHGSEVIKYVSDEAVQIFGGMGYSAECIIEPAYRDARISRIYEGTNEINRMLIVGMILKKAIKKDLPIFDQAKKVGKELISFTSFFKKTKTFTGPFSQEKKCIENMKKAILMVLGKTSQIFKDKIEDQQELLLNISDMIIELYMAESALLRAEKINNAKSMQINLVKNYIIRALDICQNNGFKTICSLGLGSTTKKIMIKGLNKFCNKPEYNIVQIRREIAKDLIKCEEYPYHI